MDGWMDSPPVVTPQWDRASRVTHVLPGRVCVVLLSAVSVNLKRVTLLERWPLMVRLPNPWRVNIYFLHPVQLLCESANVQRGGEGSQEACCLNLFPCQLPTSPLEFQTVHLHLSPSMFLFLSCSFIPSFISLPLVFALRGEKRCMIYEALFLPVTEEKERKSDKEKGEKR